MRNIFETNGRNRQKELYDGQQISAGACQSRNVNSGGLDLDNVALSRA